MYMCQSDPFTDTFTNVSNPFALYLSDPEQTEHPKYMLPHALWDTCMHAHSASACTNS